MAKAAPIISIVGATATGKTALALAIARNLLEAHRFTRIHLLSADSRQVYQGLENLTGADLPTDFSRHTDQKFIYPYFSNQDQNILIHGVSIVTPVQEWSVAHFRQLFENVKDKLSGQDLLIVVGGTGFYQQQSINLAQSILIPQNQKLRLALANCNLEELQTKLALIDHSKLKQMNHSDACNPRRLIRAIEIAKFIENSPESDRHNKQNQSEQPTFYLTLPKELREHKIYQRITQRFAQAKTEVANHLSLVKSHPNLAAFSSTGFAELRQLLDGKINQDACLQLWHLRETQYAKRQDTWWKKRAKLISVEATLDAPTKLRQCLQLLAQ